MNPEHPHEKRSNPLNLWKIGDPIPSPVQERLTLDPKDLGQKGMYKFMIGAIVPRPIAFVSTINAAGVGNVAPFSFFNGVASNPPTLMISITRKSTGDKKDTLRNIELNGQFVVNTVHEWMIGAVNQCSAEYPYGVDEMRTVGLTPLPSQKIKPPRVGESSIHFECELYKTLEVGDGSEGSATLVVGKILLIHVDQRVYQNGRIQIEALQPISRLAGTSYGRVSDLFDLERPQL
jgi:flavin reductase (DIM6/NTAB) family NADH-FMN oxidoreductase RutF